MTALPTYSTGTVSINNGDAVVVGSGTGWTDTDARAGDLIQIDTVQPIEVGDRTDATHIVLLAPWAGGNKSAVAYRIIKKAPSRFNATATMQEVSEVFRAMSTEGYYFFVKDAETEPNPSNGDDGQYAFQAKTGRLWYKTGGVWAFVGIYKGFGLPAPYDNGKTYNAFDVATSAGSSYVFINTTPSAGHAPPNATYWAVLASIGATGTAATIAVGTVTTGAPGSSATVTNAGTSGAALLNFAIPRGNTGAGDLSSPANLTDVDNVDTALTNLRGVSFGAAQALSAAQKLQAKINISVSNYGFIYALTMAAPGGTNALSISAGLAADSTGTYLISLGSPLSKTSSGWTAGTGTGGYDYSGTSADGWYHWYVILNPTTGATDAIFSANPTTPGLPSGFTHYRRIGSAELPGGADWAGFTQRGDEFLRNTPVLDFPAAAAGSTGSLVQLSVPSGIQVDALYTGLAQWSTAGTLGFYLKFSSPDLPNNTPSSSNFDLVVTNTTGDTNKAAQFRTRTNTARHIRLRSDGSGLIAIVVTHGWIDTRGRLGSA